MSITGAIVLYAVFWFLTFYIVLQVRTKTQAEAGEVVPGTPPGAPAVEDVGRSAKIATMIATAVATVAGFLGGELTPRFIAKAGCVLLVAGAILAFYGAGRDAETPA